MNMIGKIKNPGCAEPGLVALPIYTKHGAIIINAGAKNKSFCFLENLSLILVAMSIKQNSHKVCRKY
jgi:hypothetical protein